MAAMRHSIDLDADVNQLVREAMAQKGISFKQAINDGLRAGLGHMEEEESTEVEQRG